MDNRWKVLGLWLLLPWGSQAAFQAVPIAAPKDEAAVPFAVQGSLGVVNGEAKEHVFDYEGSGGTRRQLSRLDWDLNNVAMGGGNLSVRPWNWLTFNGGIWLALTEGRGEMDDYDWLDVRSSDWTHYSLSDVDVTEGYILDLNAAWDVVRADSLGAQVLLGYKQDGWTWEDQGVYLLYPEYGYVPYPLDGENMINYEQEFRMPYLGASVDWSRGAFTLAGHLTWCPVVAATDWDEHVARDLHFKETFDGGDMFGVGVEARYQFDQGIFKGAYLSAGVDYQQIDLMIGDMEIRDVSTGETDTEADVAGVENEYWIVSLGGGIRF